jgi:hypothetical protein
MISLESEKVDSTEDEGRTLVTEAGNHSKERSLGEVGYNITGMLLVFFTQ